MEEIHKVKQRLKSTLKRIDKLKKKKMRKVVARTKTDTPESIRILLKAGFYPEGYFKEHYRKRTDIIQFAKFLK